jgi:MFS transporter, putative metabolite:H+ symporter
MTQPRQLSEADLDILRRIERLPFGRFQWRLLGMGGLGYTFDALDGALIGFILPPVTALWALTDQQTGVVGASGMIGYLFGAFLATLIAAFAPSWPVLFWWRVAASVGTGAESAIIAPFLAEFVAKRHRGRFTGSLAGFFSFGWVLAALLGYLVIPRWSDGWRIVQLISALPILMLLWWRRSLPESPRWLLERGRSMEARAEVERIEAELTRRGRTTLPSLDSVEVSAGSAQRGGSFLANLAALWSRPVRRTTLMLWILWLTITFSYYGFFTWIPTLLVKQGMTFTRSFGYSIIIYLAQIPGYYSAAFVSEKLDRRWTIVVYLVLGSGAAYLLSSAGTEASITTAGVLLSFCMNGTYAGIYAYTPELYPTGFRATGMGVASAFGRLGGLSASIFIGRVYAAIGLGGVFVITTVVLVTGAMAVAVLGIATAGKSLEQITAEALHPAER